MSRDAVGEIDCDVACPNHAAGGNRFARPRHLDRLRELVFELSGLARFFVEGSPTKRKA